MSAPHAPDDLTAAQRAELDSDLHALLAELSKTLAGMRHSGGAVDLDQPIGRLSRVDAMQRQQMIVANRRRVEQRLQQVQAALNRVRCGDYGLCLSSGEPIGYRRLKARPETPFSLEAQTQIESRR